MEKTNCAKININPVIIFVSYFILGIVSFLTNTVFVTSFTLLIITILGIFIKFFSYKSAIIFYTIFALAITNCHFKIKNFDDLSKYIPADITLTGTVQTIPTTNNPNKTKFYLNVETCDTDNQNTEVVKAKTIVTIYDTEENYTKIKIGDKIKLKGKLRNPMIAKNPSQFDYAKYLKHHNAFSTFYVFQNDWQITQKPSSFSGRFLQKLNDKRNQILKHQSKYIKENNLEVLGGIVFGDDAINPPDHIKNSFINSGLLHILAASGMNVSIIFGLWFFIGIKLKLNYRFNIIVGAILVLFYTLMTGMGPSVLRAALMIEFVILGKFFDRTADSIALVFLVAFLLLTINPTMICDVGFQLSFVVTFALMYYCPPVLDKIKNKFLNFMLGALLIPFVAQIWASPIQMFYFNTYATYSIIANFLITPFIMLISFIGFLSSILAMVPINTFAEQVCKYTSYLLNPTVSTLINISDFFANLPNSLLTTFHPNLIQIAMYYTVLLLLGLALRNKSIRKKILIIIVIISILLGFSFIKKPNKNCEIIIFDVGNADSFLIKSPQNKYIIIDTAHGLLDGSISNFSQADAIINKYLKDNGIKELDILLLTHFDADHSGGAVDILKTIKVKNIILNTLNDNSKTSLSLFKFIKDNKLKTNLSQNNKIIFKENNFTLTTFTPIPLENNDNENSTIVLLSYGNFDMLFMADAGTKAFKKIKEDLNKTKIEIIKSGHHGANNTVDDEMIKALNPDSAIISTGINTYGHPHKNTLITLKKNGIKIYRTDTDNALKITANEQSYQLSKYSTKKHKFIKEYKKEINNY